MKKRVKKRPAKKKQAKKKRTLKEGSGGEKFHQMSYAGFPYQSVVVISPHPDDSVLGCGGLIAQLRGRRPDVAIRIIAATPGFRGVHDDFLKELRSDQDKEAALRDVLKTWLGIPPQVVGNKQKLVRSLKEKLGDDFALYGQPREGNDARLNNVLKSALRYGEMMREAEQLGIKSEFLRFPALVQLYGRRIVPQELMRLRIELAGGGGPHDRTLLLIPHPEDPQPAHQVVTEAALRALNPESSWHIWYYQSPWYSMRPTAVDVIVPMQETEMLAKRRGAALHRSQIDRTPYDKIVDAEGSLNADVLPEFVLGFGYQAANALGKYCEVYQIRLREFYSRDSDPDKSIVITDESIPLKP